MRQIIFILAVFAGLTSCSSGTNNNAKANLEIAKRYMNAVETNNLATMDSLLAENYMGYGPSVGDSIDKEGALASWKYTADSLYESVKYTRHQNITVTTTEADEADPGDWVSNWALLTIKYKNIEKPVNIYVNATYKIENGKIVFSRTFYNEADVLRQLGYEFVPGEYAQ